MMVRLQTHGKTLFLVVLLIAATVQVNAVFACEILGATFVNDCCCGDGAVTGCDEYSCEQGTDVLANSCCDVSLEINVSSGPDRSHVAVVSTAAQGNVDPPPGIIDTRNTAAVPAGPSEASVREGYSQVPGSASNTYLITRRLRI